MTTETNQHYVNGYQQALTDIAFQLIADGEEGVLEWLDNNLADRRLAAEVKAAS
jgi:hypothetical protein